MILCKFLRGVFTDPNGSGPSCSARGHRLGHRRAELRRDRRRIVTDKRRLQRARGLDARRTLAAAERLLAEPMAIGRREARLTPERLRTMIDGYNPARGLDDRAGPRPSPDAAVQPADVRSTRGAGHARGGRRVMA